MHGASRQLYGLSKAQPALRVACVPSDYRTGLANVHPLRNTYISLLHARHWCRDTGRDKLWAPWSFHFTEEEMKSEVLSKMRAGGFDLRWPLEPVIQHPFLTKSCWKSPGFSKPIGRPLGRGSSCDLLPYLFLSLQRPWRAIALPFLVPTARVGTQVSSTSLTIRSGHPSIWGWIG